MAEYAVSEAAFGTSEESARTAAQTFFKSLEAYDRVLATALRSGELDLPDARAKLQSVLADLDMCVCWLSIFTMQLKWNFLGCWGSCLQRWLRRRSRWWTQVLKYNCRAAGK